MARDEQIVDLKAEASRAPEAADLPHVHQAHLLPRHQQRSHLPPVRRPTVFTANGSEGGNPGGVADAAAEVPPPRETVAPVHRDGYRRRVGRTVSHYGSPVAVYLPGGPLRHADGVGGEHIVLVDAPCGAAVSLAEYPDNLQKVQVVHLRTTQGPGHEQTKETPVRKLGGEIGRYLALAVYAVRLLRGARRQRAGSLDVVVGAFLQVRHLFLCRIAAFADAKACIEEPTRAAPLWQGPATLS